jgi:hypothetical protein
MFSVVHEDREAELARTDDGDRQQEGQRVGPQGDHGDRAQDQRPGMRDQRDTLPGRAGAHLREFLLSHQVPGRDARCGQSVTHVPERLFPIVGVYTNGRWATMAAWCLRAL